MSKVVVLGAAHPHVLSLAGSVSNVQGAELAGVWDDDPVRRAATSKKLGVSGISLLDEALALEPALALIGAVPCDRAALARRAIESGASVLADKPLAVTHQALDETIEAVRRFERPIITYYPYRGDPFIRAAKVALKAGRIGRLVRVMSCGPHKLNASTRPAWHWTRKENGGCMIDVGSHHADVCCWFADESPNWICSTHCNISQPQHPEFQDFAQAQLGFPSGAVGHVEADWLNPASMKHFGDTRTWIQGTTGKIEVRLGDERSAFIWTEDVASAPLEKLDDQDEPAWTVRLMEDLCHGRPCAIPQDEVWRASRVTLDAFDSAEAGGRAIENPRF